MSTQRNILIQPAINSIDNKKPSSSKPWQSDDAIVSISWLGFKVFCQSGGATGSLWTIGLVAAMFVVSEIVFVGCDVIVAVWSDAMVAAVRNTTNTSVNGIEAVGLEAEDSDAYLAVYGACVGVFCALAVFRSIMLTSFQVRSCAFHHSRLLQSLVWDNAFATRAVRAVAAELDEIDHKTLGSTYFWMLLVARVALPLAYITMVVNFFGAFLLIFIFTYVLLLFYNRRTSFQLNSMEHRSRRRLQAQMSDTLCGRESVYLASKAPYFEKQHQQRLVQWTRVALTQCGVESWAVTWLGLVGSFVVLLTGLCLAADPDAIDAGLAGMALLYALIVLSALNLSADFVSHMDVTLSGSERAVRFAAQKDTRDGKHRGLGCPRKWPTLGNIIIDGIHVEAEAGSSGLKDCTFTVKHGTSTGIVSSDGAGTIISVITRSATLASGRVLLDNVDISTLDVDALRDRIAVVPQNTALLDGTIRFNLDPEQICTDEEIWASLEETFLANIFESLDDQLDSLVEDHRRHLSPAVCAMVGMCRALLRAGGAAAKIILVEDGRSWFNDTATDARFQHVLRNSLSKHTVVVVNPRPVTLLACDTVVVIEKGKVAETGQLMGLANEKDSMLSNLFGGGMLESARAGSKLDLLYFKAIALPRVAPKIVSFHDMIQKPVGRLPPEEMMGHGTLYNPWRAIRYVFFMYAFPLLKRGWSHSLELDDLFQLAPHLDNKVLVERLIRQYQTTKKKYGNKRGGLAWTFLYTFKWRVLSSGLFMFLENVFGLSQSLVLAQLLQGFDSGASDNDLYYSASLLVIATFLRMTFMHISAYTNWMCGMEMRASAISLLYRKVLSLRADNLTAMPSGKIITIISSDVERFTFAFFMHGMWLAPVMIMFTIAIGWQQIGPSILAGIGVTFCMLPLQMKIGKRFAKARSETAIRTDRRVNAMNDVRCCVLHSRYCMCCTGCSVPTITVRLQLFFSRAQMIVWWQWADFHPLARAAMLLDSSWHANSQNGSLGIPAECQHLAVPLR